MDIIPKRGEWTDQHHDLPNHMSPAAQAAVFTGVIGPILGLFVAIVLLWGKGINAFDLWLLLGMYTLTVIGVTIGFHRLFTHRSFQTVRWIKAFMAVAGSMSVQGPVIKWVAIHRRHHQMSDCHGDPHSPHLHGEGVWPMLKGMFHAHVGWIFNPDPQDLPRSVRDLTADPMMIWLNDLFPLWVLLGLILPAAIGWLYSHSVWGIFSGFLWGGLVRILVMHHVTWSINSVCHIWGTRPFDSRDESRNNFPIAIISFGEGWHNNHHAFPTSARHGLHWWQIDISYIFIRAMKMFGVAWDIRVPSRTAIETRIAGAIATKATC